MDNVEVSIVIDDQEVSHSLDEAGYLPGSGSDYQSVVDLVIQTLAYALEVDLRSARDYYGEWISSDWQRDIKNWVDTGRGQINHRFYYYGLEGYDDTGSAVDITIQRV